MQFENWRKKVLDGWSGMSTCRCNARSDEITRNRVAIRDEQRSSEVTQRSSECTHLLAHRERLGGGGAEDVRGGRVDEDAIAMHRRVRMIDAGVHLCGTKGRGAP